MSRSGYKNGRASYVDESLFGSKSANGAAKSQVEAIEKPAKIMASRTVALKEKDVVTLTKKDLDRMLKASPVMTADDIAAAKHEAEAKREQAQAVSKARKEKMMRLEEEAKKQAPPTETELLQRQMKDATRARATSLLIEQKDDVKHMNQMVLYSKCVTIRDAQIEEKKQMMLEEEEEQRKLDMMMEIERMKALEQYEVREKQRVEERKRGAKVLEEQIAARERERTRQEELRDQERLQMLKEVERLKEDEMQVAIEKKIQAKALLEEVAAANQEQIKRKDELKVREREEDQKISEYIRHKELRDQAVAAEKEAVARERELETARLRAQQERAADKQSEVDELRARRYQESKEREWRARERAQAERQAAMMSELADARAVQQNSKLQQRADMARKEHAEFVRVLEVNKQKEYEDLQQTVAATTLNQRYKEELLAQIEAGEEAKRKSRQAHLEEGSRLRAAADKEKALLEEIKARKLNELQVTGVPGKYRAELEKMKIRA